MNERNFVAPEGDGWVVYFNGQRVGWFANQQQAEQFFNQVSGGGGGGGSPGGYRPPLGGGFGGGGAGYSPALMAQLAAQEAMVDAKASGNREKFEEAKAQFQDAQRMQYAELFGYADAWGGRPGGGTSSSGTPAGSYTRADTGETKTIAQMRAELAGVGWPNASGASDQEVVAQYQTTTGTTMNPGGGGGSSGTGGGGGIQGPNVSLGRQLKDIYATVKNKKQLPNLQPDDPDLIQAAVLATGLDPERLKQEYKRGRDYFVATGQVIPDDVLGSSFDKDFPIGKTPTRQGRQDIEDVRRWDKDFAERQKEWSEGQYNTMARAILQAATNLRGPRDYAKYQEMVGQGRGLMDQLHGGIPQPGFGMSGEVEPARVSDILAQMGMFSRPPSGEVPEPRGDIAPGPVNFRNRQMTGVR